MSQSLLNRTSSHASCYSAVTTTTMPRSSMTRHGSIESLLHGHSKSNPANIHVIVRKNFEPFAQAHIAVTKGKTLKNKRFSLKIFPGIMPTCFNSSFVILNNTPID
jgi:hypothetical protein